MKYTIFTCSNLNNIFLQYEEIRMLRMDHMTTFWSSINLRKGSLMDLKSAVCGGGEPYYTTLLPDHEQLKVQPV